MRGPEFKPHCCKNKSIKTRKANPTYLDLGHCSPLASGKGQRSGEATLGREKTSWEMLGMQLVQMSST
jgi:hypothetical protein